MMKLLRATNLLNMSWSMHRAVRSLSCTRLIPCHGWIHLRHGSTLQSVLSSSEVREAFLNYFKSKNHLYVPSSSVIAKRNEGSYFINAGMNQFKPLFLETVDKNSEMANYERVTNSQKCIRVGGKHNDLEDVGKDTYHHTFFEMLGSWSFGNYFKAEACAMAWDLMTQVFRIPHKHLYVTYFGGDKTLGLEPDSECRDIWLKLGVAPDRIIPEGMKDNFWEMGNTGPCGPCTEIHYDYQARGNATHLFHLGHPEVVELWNLVFMQYDRQENGDLKRLPRHHVDTGMGLERLTAVLNGTTSNYATDLFQPLFSYLHKAGCDIPEYGDRCGNSDYGGVDTAYRVIADHARMFTVALSDGLLPSRRCVGFKLRHVMQRSFRYAHQVLRIPPGRVSGLVPLIAESLGDTFPEIKREQSQTIDWVNHTEDRYLATAELSRKMLHKALNKYSNSSSFLSGEQIYEIVDGRFGSPVTLETLVDLSEDYNIHLNLQDYHQIMESKHEAEAMISVTEGPVTPELDKHDLHELAELQVPPTVDCHKYSYNKCDGNYEFPVIKGKVLALQCEGEFSSYAAKGSFVGIILDKTCFYSESGGQISDVGQLVSPTGSIVEVNDVQKYGSYILHKGHVVQGQVKVEDILEQQVDEAHRLGCMRNHTATHILNLALEATLGGVSQQGSSVTPHKLTFQFSCKKPVVTEKDLVTIQQKAQEIVNSALPVYKAEADLSTLHQLQGLRKMHDVVYPSRVRVISVGVDIDKIFSDPTLSMNHSTELCGGTHVENSGDIGSIVITNFGGKSQGIKSVTAVTGPEALQALENIKTLRNMADRLIMNVSKKKKQENWDALLSDIQKFSSQLLPKIEKDEILENLRHTQGKILNEQKKSQQRELYRQKLEEEFKCHDAVIVTHLDFVKLSEIYKVLGTLKLDKPIFIVSLNQETRKNAMGICYVPQDYRKNLGDKRWMKRVCEIMGGTYSEPKDKSAKRYLPDSLVVNFNFSDKASLQRTLTEARKYVNNTMKYGLS